MDEPVDLWKLPEGWEQSESVLWYGTDAEDDETAGTDMETDNMVCIVFALAVMFVFCLSCGGPATHVNTNLG